MNNWTIICVTFEGGHFYDALESDTPIDRTKDIQFPDGEIVKAGSYAIIMPNISEQEMVSFMDLPMAQQDEVMVSMFNYLVRRKP